MNSHYNSERAVYRQWFVAVLLREGRSMEERETKYNAGGSFETTIGNTNYEVVMNFRDEGMSMQEKALRAVKEQ